jgi:hypothetical protein
VNEAVAQRVHRVIPSCVQSQIVLLARTTAVKLIVMDMVAFGNVTFIAGSPFCTNLNRTRHKHPQRVEVLRRVFVAIFYQTKKSRTSKVGLK